MSGPRRSTEALTQLEKININRFIYLEVGRPTNVEDRRQ